MGTESHIRLLDAVGWRSEIPPSWTRRGYLRSFGAAHAEVDWEGQANTMTQWLLRRFLKYYEGTGRQATRNAIGRSASLAGIFINLVLVAGKITVGMLSGSLSVIADGVNNLMDAAGSTITLAGFGVAAKQPDEEHPFGHGRFEYISGLAVAALVLLVGIELGKGGIAKILKPTPTHFGSMLLVVLAVAVLLKTWMARLYRDLGARIGSPALKAVSVDSRNDAITTGAVLLSAIVSRLSGVALDGWASVGVSLFIVYNGIGLIRETINPLLGEAPSRELMEYIYVKIASYENVRGVHDLIVHDYGPERRYASAHVEMPIGAGLVAAHEMLHRIESDFRERDGIHLIIHHDPIMPDDEGLPPGGQPGDTDGGPPE